MRILIVEDDQRLAENIRLLLKKESYAVDTADTYKEGYSMAVSEPYDAYIIDWMLPDRNGKDLCKSLRSEGISGAIMILTAKNRVDYRVEGLDAGADDYLTKPFAFAELSARLRTLLRRREKPILGNILKIADLTLDTNTMTVRRGGKNIPLSPREFALLHFLIINKGKAIDRIELLSHAWDEQTDLFSNTVDVHIRYLRKKIDDEYGKKLIRTVKGKGYMICA